MYFVDLTAEKLLEIPVLNRYYSRIRPNRRKCGMRISKMLSRLGPAFVVGACIIGPGSVMLMSKTGALYGYSMLWLSVLSGVLTCGFIILFMRFGIYSQETFLGVTRRKLGPFFAVICGLSLASTDAAFQFGNCLGVTAGMNMIYKNVPPQVWPIAFTAAAIVFMFAFKRIYGIIERMMQVLLLVMLAAFAVNMVLAKPDYLEVFKGICVPAIPSDVDWVTIGGLVATTFALVAVVFQSYTVKARGWKEKDLANGISDTLAASVIFTLIGLVIMTTAATVLFKQGIKVNSGAAMALQLETAFGRFAGTIFAIGFCAAAFSSFIVNALIGGVLINDGLGLGGKLDSKPTKIFATCVLLTGLVTSLMIIGYKPATDMSAQSAGAFAPDPKVIAIAIGQAATLLAIPFGTIATVVVLFDSRSMNGRKLSLWTKGFVLFGAAVLLGIAFMMYIKIEPTISKFFGAG